MQPVIVEYTEKAEGRILVTNDTLTPMAVVLEPKSFTISPDGRGVYRPLDASIHVDLSTTSLRLGPKQTSYIFYKATADTLPAWFTIYAGFSSLQRGEGLRIRTMLPHTVYLYQKSPIRQETLHLGPAAYQSQDKTITCDLENTGPSLTRVQEVRALAGKTSVVATGFPILPGAIRHLVIPWTEKVRPETLLLHFPHFDLKTPVSSASP